MYTLLQCSKYHSMLGQLHNFGRMLLEGKTECKISEKEKVQAIVTIW